MNSIGVDFKLKSVEVDSKNVKTTLAIGRAIQQTDEKSLRVEEQRKLAKKLVREL